MGVKLHNAKGFARFFSLPGQCPQGSKRHGMLAAQHHRHCLAGNGMGHSGLYAVKRVGYGASAVHGLGGKKT